MAKSSSFFGLRTGSTKSLTFQIYRGQQITKDRVTRVSNPRSEAQMKQRAIIPIVAASRAALKGLVDHSFEGVNYGNDSLKKFSALNLRAGALEVKSYPPNGFSNPGFASLIVSQGTLSNGDVEIVGNEDYTAVEYHFKTQAAEGPKFKATNAGDSAENVLKTIADWGESNFQVVAPGNQLTFLTLSFIGTQQIGKNEAALSAFDICRLLFPSSENTPAQVDDVNGTWKVKDKVTEGDSTVSLFNSTVVITVEFRAPAKELVFAVEPTNHLDAIVPGGALIRSTYVNGAWKRSNGAIVFTRETITSAYTYEMWRSYYESSHTSAKYLNQGKDVHQIR